MVNGARPAERHSDGNGEGFAFYKKWQVINSSVSEFSQ